MGRSRPRSSIPPPTASQERPIVAATETSDVMMGLDADTYVEQRSQSFIGPLPPPSMLKSYEDSCPGLAERIVRCFEQEGDHRREMDRRDWELASSVVQTRNYNAKVGLWLGFATAIAGLAVIAFMAAVGHPVYAAVIGGAEASAVLGVVAIGRWARNKLDTSEKPANSKTK